MADFSEAFLEARSATQAVRFLTASTGIHCSFLFYVKLIQGAIEGVLFTPKFANT